MYGYIVYIAGIAGISRGYIAGIATAILQATSVRASVIYTPTKKF